MSNQQAVTVRPVSIQQMLVRMCPEVMSGILYLVYQRFESRVRIKIAGKKERPRNTELLQYF